MGQGSSKQVCSTQHKLMPHHSKSRARKAVGWAPGTWQRCTSCCAACSSWRASLCLPCTPPTASTGGGPNTAGGVRQRGRDKGSDRGWAGRCGRIHYDCQGLGGKKVVLSCARGAGCMKPVFLNNHPGCRDAASMLLWIRQLAAAAAQQLPAAASAVHVVRREAPCCSQASWSALLDVSAALPQAHLLLQDQDPPASFVPCWPCCWHSALGSMLAACPAALAACPRTAP